MVRYFIDFEVHPNPPKVGEVAYWDGEAFVVGPGEPFKPLTVEAGEATWDCEQGLCRKLSRDDNFTLNINNLKNGMMGHFILTVGDIKPGLNITLNIQGDPTIKGYGFLNDLRSATYHICWVYDGDIFSFNTAMYLENE